jgi:Na+/glutamate symporter
MIMRLKWIRFVFHGTLFRVKVMLAGGQGTGTGWSQRLTQTVVGLSLAKRVEVHFKARAVAAGTFGIINSASPRRSLGKVSRLR